MCGIHSIASFNARCIPKPICYLSAFADRFRDANASPFCFLDQNDALVIGACAAQQCMHALHTLQSVRMLYDQRGFAELCELNLRHLSSPSSPNNAHACPIGRMLELKFNLLCLTDADLSGTSTKLDSVLGESNRLEALPSDVTPPSSPARSSPPPVKHRLSSGSAATSHFLLKKDTFLDPN